MTYLIIALIIPWTAPFIWGMIAGFRELTRKYMSAFQILVVVILAIGFIPEHFRQDQWKTFIFMGMGWGLFGFLDYVSKLSKGSNDLSLYLLAGTILLHGFGDGAGIFLSTLNEGPHSSKALLISILLHRLPASFGIWIFLIPRYPKMIPYMILATMTIGTLLGYGVFSFYGHTLITDHYIHDIEYLVAGGLIHLGFLARHGSSTGPSQKNSYIL